MSEVERLVVEAFGMVFILVGFDVNGLLVVVVALSEFVFWPFVKNLL